MDDDTTTNGNGFGFVTSPDELARIFQEPGDAAEDVVTYKIFHRACLESAGKDDVRDTLGALQQRIACFVKSVMCKSLRVSWQLWMSRRGKDLCLTMIVYASISGSGRAWAHLAT